MPALHAQTPGAKLILSLRTVLFSAALLAGCGGGVPSGFGLTAAVARARSDELLGGLAVRFERVHRAPRWDAARDKLSRHALSPSRLIGDTSVWTGVAGQDARVLELQAGPVPGRYEFIPRAGVPAPDRPGQARHVIRLARTGDGVYTWNTQVEHAVGRARAADVAGVVTGALGRLERPAADVRAELRSTLPRTAGALGRLLTLDSVATVPVGDGSTRVELRAVVRPDRLQATMPAFAAFVRKYVSSSRLAMQVTDGRGGARWLDVRAARDTVRIQMRLRDGRLLALDGPARPLPVQAELRTTTVTRYLMFDVGAADLVGDLTSVRAGHERGWQVRWRRAPQWKIPLGMRHLINGSLNRPFAGEGMQLALTLRDTDGGQTLLARRFDVAVQESAIVRWLGGLGSKAMNDLSGRAEVEEDRFAAELLRAMAADVAAALARGA